jgi:hypothetical protein
MKWFISRAEKCRRAEFERYQREDQALFDHRMNRIKELANQNMKKAEYKNGLSFMDHVVVPYEDLLKIWDIADRAKSDTPVQRGF